MTPKEYAETLYNQFYGVPLYKLSVKACCLIAVNRLLDEFHTCPEGSYEMDRHAYFEQVKEEICKM